MQPELMRPCRHRLFTTGSRSLENTPPTQAALFQHVKLTLLKESFYWRQATRDEQEITVGLAERWHHHIVHGYHYGTLSVMLQWDVPLQLTAAASSHERESANVAMQVPDARTSANMTADVLITRLVMTSSWEGCLDLAS